MKKLIILSILFLSLTDILHSQSHDFQEENKPYDWGVKISPFSILFGDYVTESFSASIAVEKKIGTFYSFQQELGYIFHSESDIGIENDGFVSFFIPTTNLHGFKTDSEIRRYLEKKKIPLEGFYLAGNIRTVYTNADLFSGEDRITVNRFLAQPNLGIGWQDINAHSGFVFDVTLGIGTRYVTSSYYPEDKEIRGSSNGWYNKDYHTGSSLNINYKFDVKIGWLFNSD